MHPEPFGVASSASGESSAEESEVLYELDLTCPSLRMQSSYRPLPFWLLMVILHTTVYHTMQKLSF